MTTYLAEVFFTPYPNDKLTFRVRRGTLESLRNSLSPDLLKFWEIEATNAHDAREQLRHLWRMYVQNAL